MILEENWQPKVKHNQVRKAISPEKANRYMQKQIISLWQQLNKKILIACFISLGLLTVGCGSSEKSAEAQSQGSNQRRDSKIPVDVAVAKTGVLRQQPEYTGTTVPFRSVSLRSQAEGRLLALNVDVGDATKQGQVIAQLDDALLRTALNQAEAELASLKSEVARAKNQVSNARAEAERLRLVVVQAQADSQRQQKLVKEGAIAQQVAEQALTEARTAAQALRAAQERVDTEQQAVAAAQGRVVAQQAAVAQAQERRSYSRIVSPINGVVTAKVTEPGNLLRPGDEILRIGDFSRAKVLLQVSEKELAKIRPGQSVQVRLDAIPNQAYTGQVARISPAADAVARLIPVEVEIPNVDGKIGSGLLARVNFEIPTQARVVVPETALGGVGEQGSRGAGEQGSRGASKIQNSQGTVFVVTEGQQGATVQARNVTLGNRADGKVEILSGLQPGEQFVARSGKPLKDGTAVRLSILSEKPRSQGGRGQ
ncbi:efflux RND transporter periplasmic adaptor subunit [Iningainema tapete]|uniref:Efflux RND transporter periplasmic adaptor subunit n=1 Tax=Iningainema tapete BLCC-T55 TaxID=2748662 RepID=A0A8J6XKS3_9CYAN|nr:efflux RND transporter periplasmic adaptor subunit [Iningainema tapete BLCC-T55]